MKELARRSVLSTVVIVLAATVLSVPVRPAAAAGEDYPSRPVTLVVPASPGGTTDFTARLLAKGLTEELGQQVIVENKGGASGNLATGLVARAEPDGHTLLLTYSGYHATNPALFDDLDWDPVESFEPVALATKAPHVFVVHKDLPVNSLAELIEYAKAHPGELNYASPGVGSIPHIGTEQFLQQTGTEMVHVPYKGTGPAMTDLLAGVVNLSLTTPPSAAGHLREGSVKGLAIASDQRHPMLPDVPTTAEAGLPGFEQEAWFALYAPTGTPQAIVDKIAEAAEKVITSEDFQRQAQEQGTYAAYMGPEELGEFTKSEIARLGQAIEETGITMEE